MAGEARNRPPHGASQRAAENEPSGETGRDRYRDDDDARDPVSADDRDPGSESFDRDLKHDSRKARD